MGVCCVSAEVVYLAAHAATDWGPGGVGGIRGPLPPGLLSSWLPMLDFVDGSSSKGGSRLAAVADTAVVQLALLMIPGWIVKQVANVAQLWGSCQALVRHDFPNGTRINQTTKKKR